jgi:sulfide:quinone oxidoreductase
MKRLLILGAGTAGIIMANKMCRKLPSKEWEITVAEKQMDHYYQPGFLFLPFGYYRKKDIVKQAARFIPEIEPVKIIGIAQKTYN